MDAVDLKKKNSDNESTSLSPLRLVPDVKKKWVAGSKTGQGHTEKGKGLAPQLQCGSIFSSSHPTYGTANRYTVFRHMAKQHIDPGHADFFEQSKRTISLIVLPKVR